MPPKATEKSKLAPNKSSYEAVASGPSEGLSKSMVASLAMEFIGTFFLCLTVGLAAELSKQAGLAIGIVLMCFVYAGAHVSGSNYNPAVTLSLVMTGHMKVGKAMMYIVDQLAAGVAAAAVADVVLSADIGHPSPGHEVNVVSAVLAEVLFTAMLCTVVLNTAAAESNTPNQFYGLAIGFTVVAGAAAVGPISGGAFNPAVGLGLPLFAGDLESVLLYAVTGVAGSAVASAVWVVTAKGGEMAALAMEFIGTFFLCFTVAGAAVLSPGLAPIAIGGMLMSGVYAGAHVSGANFNPAVSFSLLLTKHLSFAKTITYTAVQGLAGLAAAFAAVLVLETEKIGHPAVGEDFNIVDAFIVEAVFTFALCFVVLNVACAEPNHGNQYYGLAIGFTVTAAAEAIGSISGCALNPAVAVLAIIAAPKRIVETAIVHIGAPMAGGFAAAMAYRVTNPEEFSK